MGLQTPKSWIKVLCWWVQEITTVKKEWFLRTKRTCLSNWKIILQWEAVLLLEHWICCQLLQCLARGRRALWTSICNWQDLSLLGQMLMKTDSSGMTPSQETFQTPAILRKLYSIKWFREMKDKGEVRGTDLKEWATLFLILRNTLEFTNRDRKEYFSLVKCSRKRMTM